MLCYCDNFPRIDISSQELDNNHSNKCHMISFHVYKLIACCSAHGITPLDGDKIFACVGLLRLKCHPQNYAQEKSLL